MVLNTHCPFIENFFIFHSFVADFLLLCLTVTFYLSSSQITNTYIRYTSILNRHIKICYNFTIFPGCYTRTDYCFCCIHFRISFSSLSYKKGRIPSFLREHILPHVSCLFSSLCFVPVLIP